MACAVSRGNDKPPTSTRNHQAPLERLWTRRVASARRDWPGKRDATSRFRGPPPMERGGRVARRLHAPPPSWTTVGNHTLVRHDHVLVLIRCPCSPFPLTTRAHSPFPSKSAAPPGGTSRLSRISAFPAGRASVVYPTIKFMSDEVVFDEKMCISDMRRTSRLMVRRLRRRYGRND